MDNNDADLIQNISPDNDPNLSATQKIDISLVTMVYKQSTLGLLASLFCATVVLIGLFDHENQKILLEWYGFFMFVTVIRAILVLFYMRQENMALHLSFWRAAFVVGALLGGISWGLTGSLLFPEVSSFQQTLIALILAGTAAGAVPVLSGVLWASIAFLISALFPLIVTLLYIRNDTNVLFDLTVFVFLSYLIALSIRTYNTLRTSISLQYEKIALLNNLSEAKHQLEDINERLVEAATHDPLTKVANRNLFITRLEMAAGNVKASKKMLALLYLDLDKFKMVNDVYGHHVGDQLLIILVERLGNLCKKEDVISRLGGDEFTIILENITNPYDVAKICKRICQAVAAPVQIGNLDLKVTASIGVAIFPMDSQDIDKLLNIADSAMYYVKERGGNNYRFNVELLTE